MMTLYLIKRYGILNAGEEARFDQAEGQALIRAGLAHPADSPEAAAARAAHLTQTGEPASLPHRTIKTNASPDEVAAWLKG
jgi:hypothetical protein